MDKSGSAFKDILIVTLITLVAGMMLGFVYNITKEPIANEKLKTRIASQQAVFSEASSFEATDGSDTAGFADKYLAALETDGITGVTLNSIDIS